jgi:hypothetical protein
LSKVSYTTLTRERVSSFTLFTFRKYSATTSKAGGPFASPTLAQPVALYRFCA